MAGDASRQNGMLGGRPRGAKNKRTLEREVFQKAYEQMALKKLEPVFHSQLLAALGSYYVYRKEFHGTGASRRVEHVQLTNPWEIKEALNTIENDENVAPSEDGFVYICAKPAETRAIDSILDRSIGKATTKLEHTGKDGGPIEVKGVEIVIRK